MLIDLCIDLPIGINQIEQRQYMNNMDNSFPLALKLAL